MSTANTATQVLIDQRLDAIDRALLGLLSRNQRLAMVSQLESQIREAVDSAIDLSGLTAPEELPATTISLAGRGHRTTRKRSKLAIWSGVIGMVALALLAMAPITYFLLGILADVCGESISILLLGTHVTLVVLLGATAVGLAIVSLVRLRGRAMLGHGWAITGLCTGPLPVVVGGLMALVLGVELLATEAVSVHVAAVPANAPVFDKRDTNDERTDYGSTPACAAPICMPVAPAASPRCAAPACQAVGPAVSPIAPPKQGRLRYVEESAADSVDQPLPPLPTSPDANSPGSIQPPDLQPKVLEDPVETPLLPNATRQSPGR